jgi:hypothetical protein
VFSAVEADRPEDAEQFLRKALAAYDGRDWAYYFQYALYAQAMLDWRNGLVPRALVTLRGVSRRLLAMQAMQAAVLVLVDQAALAAEAQDAAAGEEAAAGLALLTHDVDHAPGQAMVEIGLSWASVASGEPDAAAAHARHALDLLSEQRLPFWTSRAHEALAHALQAHDPAAALTALEAAGRGFEPCGAIWRQRRTYDAMRRVGSAGRRLAARAGGSALTAESARSPAWPPRDTQPETSPNTCRSQSEQWRATSATSTPSSASPQSSNWSGPHNNSSSEAPVRPVMRFNRCSPGCTTGQRDASRRRRVNRGRRTALRIAGNGGLEASDQNRTPSAAARPQWPGSGRIHSGTKLPPWLPETHPGPHLTASM